MLISQSNMPIANLGLYLVVTQEGLAGDFTREVSRKLTVVQLTHNHPFVPAEHLLGHAKPGRVIFQ